MHDLAWAAGLFEGEGCISISATGRVILALVSTDEDVVLSFHKVIGTGLVTGPSFRPRCKPIWRWTATRRDDVLPALDALLPYLHRRRREQADKAVTLATAIRGKTRYMRGIDVRMFSGRAVVSCRHPGCDWERRVDAAELRGVHGEGRVHSQTHGDTEPPQAASPHRSRCTRMKVQSAGVRANHSPMHRAPAKVR